MSKYSRKYRKLRKLRFNIPTISRKRRLKAQRLMSLGAIFIFGLIMLILLLWLFYSSFFAFRIDINDVAAMKIPPKEMTYIYEICREQQKDEQSVLTTYLVYNRFFREKQTAKTKEQLQMDFMPKTDAIRKRIPDRLFNKYYSIIETLSSEIKTFPIPITQDTSTGSYMYGDTWGTKREMCGSGNHVGCDIFDRENIPGRLPVVSMTSGTVENRGKNGRGGMYLGIRTERGTYYLYDNFERINENLETGTVVSPGSPLGYMGNGGRPDSNSTNGKSPTNIHLGVKVKTNLSKKEIWINIYPFLRLLEDVTYNEYGTTV